MDRCSALSDDKALISNGGTYVRANHKSYVAFLLASTVMGAAAPVLAQSSPPALDIPAITVTATPLPAFALDARTLPVPVQTVSQEQLARSQALTLAQYLNQNLAGVFINDAQNNPFQPDLNFRGYTASPLLGTPQGIAVYMDGVRLNQPFGDVVSWDLIPKSAIKTVTLIPGSNPVFGLNALGGALSIQTKDGRSNPGTSIMGSYGSFERMIGEFEHGGSSDAIDWYVTGTIFDEDGWRDVSPSTVRQVFGKLGWQGDGTDLKFSAAYADNDLIGNGLQEMTLLARDYRSIYTSPDETHNQASFFNFEGKHSFSDTLMVSGNAYYRNIRTQTLNGDINDDSLDQSVYQPNAAERAALTAAGYTGFPLAGENAANTPFPRWRCIAQGLLNDEPAEKCNGLLNRTASKQNNYGVTAQLSWMGAFAGLKNTLTAGAAYDANDVEYAQLSELGYLTPQRTVVGIGAFGDGVTGGDEDGVPYDTRVGLGSKTKTASVYVMDTIGLLNDTLNITISGRYNHTTVKNRDRILPATAPDTLTADHAFNRFNPAVGFTYAPIDALSVYGGYAEANRAPSAIELGCSNPDFPCKLPNAFAGDPPLEQVVSRTWEAGLRGAIKDTFSLSWSAGLFRSAIRNDILFVADDAAGFGYFKNFGKTRRQGIELSAEGKYGRFQLGGNYSLLDATFRSPEEVGGTGNSTNEENEDGTPGVEGTIDIVPGNKIPLTPRHQFKFHVDYEVVQGLVIGAESLTMSGMYARGNENNAHQPDGVYYIGPGKTKGYTVFALRAQYLVNENLMLFTRVDNVFDKKYATSAVLGGNGFTPDGNFIARRFPAINGEFPVQQSTFYAPGMPRAVFGGVKVMF
jgi:outer membrane receptor protein involved in Fe transport